VEGREEGTKVRDRRRRRGMEWGREVGGRRERGQEGEKMGERKEGKKGMKKIWEGKQPPSTIYPVYAHDIVWCFTLGS
jgi:hypothetical protein